MNDPGNLYRLNPNGMYEPVMDEASRAQAALASAGAAVATGQLVKMLCDAWETTGPAERKDFAAAVLRWAADNLSEFKYPIVQMLQRAYERDQSWVVEALFQDPELRPVLRKAMKEALHDSWSGRDLVRSAMAAAAHRELGELAREMASDAVATVGDDDA